jgi:hypothetical protein
VLLAVAIAVGAGGSVAVAGGSIGAVVGDGSGRAAVGVAGGGVTLGAVVCRPQAASAVTATVAAEKARKRRREMRAISGTVCGIPKSFYPKCAYPPRYGNQFVISAPRPTDLCTMIGRHLSRNARDCQKPDDILVRTNLHPGFWIAEHNQKECGSADMSRWSRLHPAPPGNIPSIA